MSSNPFEGGWSALVRLVVGHDALSARGPFNPAFTATCDPERIDPHGMANLRPLVRRVVSLHPCSFSGRSSGWPRNAFKKKDTGLPRRRFFGDIAFWRNNNLAIYVNKKTNNVPLLY